MEKHSLMDLTVQSEGQQSVIPEKRAEAMLSCATGSVREPEGCLWGWGWLMTDCGLEVKKEKVLSVPNLPHGGIQFPHFSTLSPPHPSFKQKQQA